MLAEHIGSGQSRVAKMQAAHPSVSFELLVKALLATGVSMADIGAVIATGDPDASTATTRAKRPRGVGAA